MAHPTTVDKAPLRRSDMRVHLPRNHRVLPPPSTIVIVLKNLDQHRTLPQHRRNNNNNPRRRRSSSRHSLLRHRISRLILDNLCLEHTRVIPILTRRHNPAVAAIHKIRSTGIGRSRNPVNRLLLPLEHNPPQNIILSLRVVRNNFSSTYFEILLSFKASYTIPWGRSRSEGFSFY